MSVLEELETSVQSVAAGVGPSVVGIGRGWGVGSGVVIAPGKVLTNAHAAGVEIKIARTRIDRYVDRIVNAFEVGHLKTRPEYWPTCQRLIGFDPSRSLYIDDDEACLAAAQQYGIGYLYHRSKSSSRLPAQPSSRYVSIESLHALITP